MEKNSALKSSAFSLLQKTKLFIMDTETPTLLPQMPIEQILYFLRQAHIKSKVVTIQTIDREDSTGFHEFTGKILVAPEENEKIILSSLNKQTYSVIQRNEVRYIQLTNTTYN